MRWFIAGLLILVAVAQEPVNEEALWLDFLAWWRTQPHTVEDPQPGYCALRRLGADECERRFIILKRKSQEHLEDSQAALFDRVYSAKTPPFKSSPSQLLSALVEDVKPGTALDVHMGQGRNAIFLAQKGWKVTGFDISQEAIQAAKAEATRARVVIDARREGHEHFDFGKSRWDLIVMTYAWIPLDDAALLERIMSSLRPGGRVVFEHYRRPTCRPPEKGEWVPCANEMLKVFQRLRVVYYQETNDLPDWASRKSELVRLVAQMPAEAE